MGTTNYSLPTILGTNAFDLVTDYNALANATDEALASVAGLIPSETITEMQGHISSLQSLTGSQDTQITTLKSQMTAANGNISTLQAGLVTANSNIGKLQTGLQSANNNIGSLQKDLQATNTNVQSLQTMMTPTIVLTGLSMTSGKILVSGNVFCNPAAKILIFSMNAKITYNFSTATNPKFSAFSQALPSEYLPTQNKRIYVGSAMSGTAGCNLQLDIDAKTGTITPNIGGINNVNAFAINGNAVLMYDIPADANNL